MIVLDTSVAIAVIDRRDRRHADVSAWYLAAEDDMATTPFAVAEIDYLVASKLSAAARAAFHRDLRAGSYGVTWWDGAEKDAAALTEQYGDLGLSLTDSSLVALAARLGTTEIATLDERHFRAMRPLAHGAAFRLLPADA